LCAVFGGIADQVKRMRQISVWLLAAAHLHERDLRFLLVWHGGSVAPPGDVKHNIAKRSK
jgi:hypothetical protein